MRALRKRVLLRLRAIVEERYQNPEARYLLSEIDRCLAPSRAVRTKKRHALPSPAYTKYATRKKKSRRVETSAIRAACLKRADGLCECCGGPFCSANPPTMDHFEGGSDKRAQESVEGCWMLRLSCHRMKSAEVPSRAYWLKTFMDHCRKYGYPVERVEAQLARIEAGLAGGAA